MGSGTDAIAAVAAPRNAATVALLRDGPRGVETYLLRRAPSMAFAAGMHVFPGGSVDPRDADPGGAAGDVDVAEGAEGAGWAGPSAGDWGKRFAVDAVLARELVCAAVREMFEESGILLAGPSATEVVQDTTDADWEADRLALLGRDLSLAGLLRRRRLVLRSDLLRAWGHWITPELEPRRFDTRFFVAAVPAGQRTRDVGGEADHVTWLPVREAVDGYDGGALPMLPPTAVTLRELSAYDDVASVLAAHREIRSVQPRAVVDGDTVRLVVDGLHGEHAADELRA